MKALIDFLIALFRRPAPAATAAQDAGPAGDDPFPLSAAQMESALLAAGAQGHQVAVPAIAAALRAACLRYGITDILPIAHLIAQIAHESGGFRYTREYWGPTPAQLRYEGNKNLGNTEPGDGRKFAGMFWIQLTGRWNHSAYAQYRSIGLETLHASADDPYTNADVCLWYIVINRPGFLAAARQNDVLAVSIAVNGKNRDGFPNGWQDRQLRTRAVLQSLGVAL